MFSHEWYTKVDDKLRCLTIIDKETIFFFSIFFFYSEKLLGFKAPRVRIFLKNNFVFQVVRLFFFCNEVFLFIVKMNFRRQVSPNRIQSHSVDIRK